MTLDTLGFGVAGFPSKANKKDPVTAIRLVKDIGLDCIELEFAHGIRMRDETAVEINKTARELGIALTAHAPYYINLNAKEQDKIDASINRLLQTARLAGMCGAYSMTFHAAFYMKDDPSAVFGIVKKYLNHITGQLRSESNPIHLRPELTGKSSQFGSLKELCELSKEVAQVYPCLDFTQVLVGDETGVPIDYGYFLSVFEKYKKALGKTALTQMHIHVGGVEMGANGEVKRIPIEKSSFDFRGFLQACKDAGVKGAIICDSSEQEKDALMLKRIYHSLEKTPKIKKAS